VITSDQGVIIADKEDLAELLVNKTNVEVFVISKKVSAITVIPGKKNLLSGEADKDAIEVEYV
jgi:hypothetical protein